MPYSRSKLFTLIIIFCFIVFAQENGSDSITTGKNTNKGDDYGIVEETIDGQPRLFLTAPMPEAIESEATSVVHPRQVREIFKKELSTGQVLCATGALTHFSGLCVWFIGYVRGFTISTESEFTGVLVQRMIGGSLMAIGPIPSCVGATKVRNSATDLIGQADFNESWSLYGRGWAFMAGSTLVGITGSIIVVNSESEGIAIISTILNIALGIAGEAFWIGSVVNANSFVSSYKRKNDSGLLRFRIIPTTDFKDKAGINLVGIF